MLCFDTEKVGNREKKGQKFKEYVRKMAYRDSKLWNCEWGKALQCLQQRHLLCRRETGVRSQDKRRGVLQWNIMERRLQR